MPARKPILAHRCEPEASAFGALRNPRQTAEAEYKCCGTVSRPFHLRDRRSPISARRVLGDLRSTRWHGQETMPQQPIQPRRPSSDHAGTPGADASGSLLFSRCARLQQAKLDEGLAELLLGRFVERGHRHAEVAGVAAEELHGGLDRDRVRGQAEHVPAEREEF